MKYLHLMVLATLTSQPVWAKKVALVVGGATTSGEKSSLSETPRNHEFGRSTARATEGLKAKGYEVTTLFDNVGIDVASPDEGEEFMKIGSGVIRKEMKKDYDKLASMNASAATEENLIASLRNTMKSLKAGDQFEFTMSVHGLRFCDGKPEPERSTLDVNSNSAANCKHVIVLNDPKTGKPTYVDTQKIADVIKEMDDKGIETNLTLTSCHSGQAQDMFKGLKNTCVLLAASGNNWGMSCMPDDKPNDTGYMAALDAVNTSFWKDIAPRLMKDEYFKDDPCTQKLLNQYNSGIGGDNRYDLFMSARAKDASPTEPTISSQFGSEYFQKGRFSSLLINGLYGDSNEICEQKIIDTALEDIIKLGGTVMTTADREELTRLFEKLKASMTNYDVNIKRQKEIVEKITKTKSTLTDVAPKFNDKMEKLPQKPEDIALYESKKIEFEAMTTELRRIQAEALDGAPEIMKHERALVDYANKKFIKPQLPENDPCLRKSSDT